MSREQIVEALSVQTLKNYMRVEQGSHDRKTEREASRGPTLFLLSKIDRDSTDSSRKIFIKSLLILRKQSSDYRFNGLMNNCVKIALKNFFAIANSFVISFFVSTHFKYYIDDDETCVKYSFIITEERNFSRIGIMCCNDCSVNGYFCISNKN